MFKKLRHLITEGVFALPKRCVVLLTLTWWKSLLALSRTTDPPFPHPFQDGGRRQRRCSLEIVLFIIICEVDELFIEPNVNVVTSNKCLFQIFNSVIKTVVFYYMSIRVINRNKNRKLLYNLF